MRITLEAVRAAEEKCGAVYALAQKVRWGTATDAEVAGFTAFFGIDDSVDRYEAAGRLLLEILTWLNRAGLVVADPQTRGRVDYAAAQRFFLGVLGWEPDALWRQASPQDLAGAYEGFCGRHGGRARLETPDRKFLDGMLEKEQG